MRKIRIGFFVGSLLLGLSLVGCSKKTTKNTTTTKSNTVTKSNTTTKKIEKVNVIFDSNGGSPVDSQSIEKGTYATKPNDPTREGYTFGGWYYGDEEWAFNSSAIVGKITLTAKWKPYVRNGNKLYFGYYPQKIVGEETTITELNTLVGTPENPEEGYTWVDYGYYNEYDVFNNFMFYIDLDTDNDGKYDYRGVYFTCYRPYSIFRPSESTYQDNNGYSIKTTYWFKYEMIEWNILDEQDGRAMLISNLCLDSQEFYSSRSQYKTEHNGGTGYSNNYALSNIRKWLNDTFYNAAFNDIEKAIIKEATVDNSLANNQYACEDTNDMIFLLSEGEANNTNYFQNDNERITVASDYALVQGTQVYEYDDEYLGKVNWLLRSPISSEPIRVGFVGYHGGGGSGLCYDNSMGTRPALWIEL